jgi:hypothetical protein
VKLLLSGPGCSTQFFVLPFDLSQTCNFVVESAHFTLMLYPRSLSGLLLAFEPSAYVYVPLNDLRVNKFQLVNRVVGERLR